METYSDWLAHHGIKGMKWDKRNGPPYPLSDAQRSSTENRLNPTSRSAKLLQLDRARGRKISGTGSNKPVLSKLTNKPLISEKKNLSSKKYKKEKDALKTSLTGDDLEDMSTQQVIDALYQDNPKFIYQNVTDLINRYGAYDDIKDPNTIKKIESELSNKYGSTIANTLMYCYKTDEGEQDEEPKKDLGPLELNLSEEDVKGMAWYEILGAIQKDNPKFYNAAMYTCAQFYDGYKSKNKLSQDEILDALRGSLSRKYGASIASVLVASFESELASGSSQKRLSSNNKYW